MSGQFYVSIFSTSMEKAAGAYHITQYKMLGGYQSLSACLGKQQVPQSYRHVVLYS
jgi:hypothetical protein